jgi:hypothetical protein
MARNVWDEPIDKNIPWDGNDDTNNLPVRGRRVEEFLKGSLNSKIGVLFYDTTNNRYLAFADEEERDKYIADPTQTELILGSFDAPFNYTAEINLASKSYNAVFIGSSGHYIDFTFDVKNKQGASTGESVIIKYTFMRGSNKREMSEIKPFGSAVHFNIDKYLAEGTNTIIVSVMGQNTLAATSVAITYEVVNLQLNDTLDISKVYNLTSGIAQLEVPYSISGYGTKIVEWHIDGEQLTYVKAEDEIVESNTTRTKHITLSNLSQGVHSLQFRAYTTVNGELFYTSTLYRDIIVYTGVKSDVIIAIATSIPSEYGILGTDDKVALYDMVQYVPYTLRFATYSPSNTTNIEVKVKVDNSVKATINSNNGIENSVVIVPTTYGTKHIEITADNTKYEIDAGVTPTTMDIQEITNGLEIDFVASDKANNSDDRDTWEYGDYRGTLTGFAWNNTSGWVNGRLEMTSGSTFEVNYAPLVNNPTSLGKTIEIEWSTKNVKDDNAVICDLRNSDGVGIVIYATKVSMTSADGVTIETEYKSDENVRIAFVINRSTGSTHQCMSFIYANGILSRGDKWALTDSYTSNALLKFQATDGAELSLKSIRIYNDALSSDNILNNYILYRDTVEEMMEIYDRNDVYEDNRDIFSPTKMSSRLPVMIVTGDIPTLENTSDKDTQITVDIEYTNLQDPSRSFKMVGAAMRPQGTSSMGYPKKNFRIYTQKLDTTVVYDATGNVVTDKLYSFKDGAQPVNCWCLKADYAESSGTHNTGIARLWNDALYNAQIDGEYKLRTEAQRIAAESGYEYDVRTTIDGFPILLFYRPSANDDVIFIGKYNFNNDKSTESVFGFEGIPNFDNTKMQCWEVLNNGNPLALFTTTDNFDATWSEAFESRYPDTKTPDITSLKAFAQWMSTVSQDSFAKEKWDHMDVYKMAAYWVYLMRHAGADQFVKNAMFTSEDGDHFYYILYDNDTINGLINTGYLLIKPTDTRQTVDESGSYVFAGHDSRLWNMLEADNEFINIVAKVDNALYSAGISYDNTIRVFDDEQADKWVEKVYNQDAMYKYISPYVDKGINNLFMLQGKRDLHRRWWLAKRFSIYDAKYVSGQYKSLSIELKCINGTPAGQEFTVTAGYPIDYGYGINNIPRKFGVPLEVGESYTFSTSEVVNLGDPIRIYGAPNIAELDLSKMADRLAVVTISNVYEKVLGTRLTKLVIGSEDVSNLQVKEISGLRQATMLEYLDVQGMQALTSLDLSSQLYFKSLKAHNTGIATVAFAKGAPVTYLELPASMRVLSLEQLPLLDSDNIIMEDLSNVSIVTITDCPNVSNDFDFIYNWVMANSGRVGDLTLNINRVDWGGISGDQLVKIARVGSSSITGRVKLTDITEEQGNLFTSVWGDTIFDENAEFFIDAPVTVTVSGASSVLKGDSTTFTASIFPSVNGHFEWSLPTQVDGVSIDSATGKLVTTERGADNYNVVVRATFIFDNGDAPVSGDAIIEVVNRTYPEGVSIIGVGELTENTSFTWEYSNSGVNGYYDEIWSLEGDIANYYEVHYSQGVCVLNKTNAPADTVSGRLRLDIERNFDGAIINSAYIEITHTVVWMKDATIIGNTNPLEQPMEYTWETTTQGVNGDYYAEWSLEGDVTSVVKIKTQTNDKCTLEVLNVVTEVVPGTITLKLRKQYDNSVIVTATKTLAAVMEGVVITSVSNAPLQSSLYNAGLVANETYSLKEELERITNEQFASLWATLAQNIIHFNEFEYFSSVTTFPTPQYYSKGLIDITFPNSLTKISEDAFRYSNNLEIIKNSFNITSIGARAFNGCYNLIDIEDLSKTSSIGTNAFSGCVKLNYLRFPNANQAPSLGTNVFGYNSSNYTGISASNKRIYLSLGAQGFYEGQWLDPLQNPSKCGFTIYGKLVINANNPTAKFTITYTTVGGETKAVNVNGGVSYLSDVQYDTNMTIRVIEGGIPEEGVEKTFVYSDANNTHTFTFARNGSWITIDQTITDPSTMISGDINGEHIQAIRNNSHRYLGKYTANGQMTICQLDDANSNLYIDGTSANLTGTEGDVFVKLPRFWYAAIEKETNVWEIGFYYGVNAPSEIYWNEWDGDDLIGAFPYGKTSDRKMRSISGVNITGNYSSFLSFNDCTSYATSRGTGYTHMPFKWYNMITWFYYAEYGTTNFRTKFEDATGVFTTGVTSINGMNDTTNGGVNNLYGVEGMVLNLAGTFIGNVLVDYVNPNHVWKITESDGTVRSVVGSKGSTGYIDKVVIGDSLDFIPLVIDDTGVGSDSTIFCTIFERAASSNRVVSVQLGQLITASKPNNNSYAHGRLAFRGTIIEETDPVVFKSLTAIN